ncbi:NADP-dependent oxidoreductase [Xanthovirga aplysinae]|uniref:NADP-dependent oxidoreductase n=1 Tax=Xanthovirga aplysinae TaxID=2529853 RepID=UPI0012BB9E17|nr:NADP-dependent oxidoreductase [Xanthovirga aplysinae]MTI30737.1 NADP-dependent oxidoreductase [Xanthovirga aplysinae]
MKALKITGYGNPKENLDMQEVALPSIKENEVLIKIHAASVNPIDNILLSGAFDAVMPVQFPGPIGFDVAGTVIEKGAAVKNFNIGDKVYSRLSEAGAIAEYVASDSAIVAQKPTNISFEEAAGLPLVGLTAMHSLKNLGRIKAGDKVFIQAGSGGVGTFAIQYAKSKGAYVATTTSTKNVEWIKSLGADLVIDYTKEDYTKFISGYDIVLMAFGDEHTLEVINSVNNVGKLIGLNGALDKDALDAWGVQGEQRAYLENAGKHVLEAAMEKGIDYRFTVHELSAAQLDEITQLVENKAIKPVVDKVFGLDDSIQALEYLASGRAKGKVVIQVQP